MEGPKFLESLLNYQSVQSILRYSQLEGQFAHHQSEHQHPKCKNIAQLTIIPLLSRMMAGMYLRSHVTLTCPFVFTEKHPLAFPLKVPGKPKITQFNGQLTLLPKKQDIFQLEVPVGDAAGMQVGDSVEELSKESLLEFESG